MLYYFAMDEMDSNISPKISRREQEVWRACDELWNEFQATNTPISQLTGERIKKKLVELGYKRGNQNQIYQFRNSWKNHHGITDITYKPTPLKQEVLNEKIENAVASVMSLMEQETKEKIHHLNEESLQRIQVAEEKAQLLAQQVQDQLSYIQQKDHALTELEDTLQQTQEQNYKLESEYIRIQERLSQKNEQLETALEESRLSCQQLSNQVQKLTKDLEKLNKQYLMEKASNKTLETQLNNLLDKVLTTGS